MWFAFGCAHPEAQPQWHAMECAVRLTCCINEAIFEAQSSYQLQLIPYTQNHIICGLPWGVHIQRHTINGLHLRVYSPKTILLSNSAIRRRTLKEMKGLVMNFKM